MKFYLGVDGGGSKTIAVIADEHGQEVARAYAGNGNHQVDRDQAEQSLTQAVDGVIAHAGLRREDLAAAVFGLAGADREPDFKILRPLARRLGITLHDVVCDTHIALRAGTNLPYGIACICGTGTNMLGIAPDGRAHQCGGFGYAYGDFGGGGDLAVEAFRAAVRDWQGRGPQTLLAQRLPEKLGYPDMAALYNASLDAEYYHPTPDLTPLLFEVAEQDRVSRSILARQGAELGMAASAVTRALGMERLAFDVVLAGSVVQRGDSSGKYVRPFIARVLQAAAPNARLRLLGTEPVLGALLLAMELDHSTVPEKVHSTLTKALAV